MMVGICPDEGKYLSTFSKKYQIILDYNNIPHCIVNVSNPEFFLNVKNLDFFIFRWKHTDYHHQLARAILPVIENELKIKCFPDIATSWHYDDKIRQYYTLKAQNLPFAESYIFWDREDALQWSETASFPVVFKLARGAGSSNVLLIKTKHQAKKYIKLMFDKGIKNGVLPCAEDPIEEILRNFKFYFKFFLRKYGVLNVLNRQRFDYRMDLNWNYEKNYVMFQHYLPGNKYDTRITIIGGRAFAFRRFNREGDFRASGSGKIDYDPSKIDINMIKTALDISSKLKFQSMAYDFLYDENGHGQIGEISYTFVDHAVWNCPGYWDSNLNWHEGHFWPQYLQLKDLLGVEDLKQPEMSKEISLVNQSKHIFKDKSFIL